MRNIKYIGTKPTEDAFFDRTQIIWTPGKVDTVLDDAVATEMLRFAEFEDAGDSQAVVNGLTLDPTTGAMQIGGAAPTLAQRASVRAGIGADRTPKVPQPYPLMRDLSVVVAGVTTTIRTLANSIAAGFTVAFSPLTSCKVLGCATEIAPATDMHFCLTANPQDALIGVEQMVFGNKLSLRFYARNPVERHYWIFVNDKPATAEPVAYTSGGFTIFTSLDIDLPDDGPNLVTVYASNVLGLVGVACGANGAIIPSERQARKVAITGDSFVTGSAMNSSNAFNAFTGILAVRYGFDVLNNGYGGTGYVNDGGASILKTYGHASRIKNVELFAPDEHMLFGGINDNGLSGIAEAVSSTITAYRAAHNCPTSVIGPQPTGTDKTLLASLVTARLVYSAVNGNSYVDKYLDPIGGADQAVTPSAYPGGLMANGARVVVNNAIWELAAYAPVSLTPTQGPMGTDAGPRPHWWKQRTKWLHGTGNAGSGTGTRAVFLGTDNTHYTTPGNQAIAVTVNELLRE